MEETKVPTKLVIEMINYIAARPAMEVYGLMKSLEEAGIIGTTSNDPKEEEVAEVVGGEET